MLIEKGKKEERKEDMDKAQFTQIIMAALLGSGRVRRDNFNTYDVARLVDLTPQVAERGWQFQLVDGSESSYFSLLLYASLLGSKGCISQMDEPSYGFLWDEAFRIEKIVKRFSTNSST